MSLLSDFYVEPANWAADESAIRAIRESVFVDEQGIAVELEFDDADAKATHFLAYTITGEAVGTARLNRTGQIGRLAVLGGQRGRGIGTALLRTVIESARNMRLEKLQLGAQDTAIGFYQRFGFVALDQAYAVNGIAHQKMQLPLHYDDDDAPATADPSRHNQELQDHQQQTLTGEFHGLGELRQAIKQLLQRTTKELLIYSRDLDPLVLGQADIVRMIAVLVNQTTQAAISIIVHDPDRAIKEGHLLLPLAQRKPGIIDFRIPSKGFRDYPAGFIVGDRQHTIYRELATYPEGELRLADPSYAQRHCEYFQQVWDFGDHDSNLRSLYL